MRLLWWRKPKDPRPEQRVDDTLDVLVRGVIHDLHRNPIKVSHTIEHKPPRPRPTTIQPVILNTQGQEYRTLPINATDRHTVPVYFPLVWLTGNPRDNGVQCGFRLELGYDPDGGRW